MRRGAAGAVLLASGHLLGCSVGVGGAYVGKYRAHDAVQYEACLEDAAGRCADTRVSTRHVPARSFTGAVLAFPALGAAVVTHDGDTSARFRVDGSLEVLAGKGRFAVGGRTDVLFDDQGAVSVPVTIVGHASLLERLSVHAGVGYVPYSNLAGEISLVGARALAGVQIGLIRASQTSYVVLTVETDLTWVDFTTSYLSNGYTTHLGFFF